jgi:hypothetical protein
MQKESIRYYLTFMVCLITLLGGCEESVTPDTPEYLPFSVVNCLAFSSIGIPSHVFNSKAELDSVVTEWLCSETLIDFSIYTLLYQYAGSGGCEPSFLENSIIKDSQHKQIIYKLRIIEHGGCMPDLIRGQWVLIAKVPEGYQVVFQKERVRDRSAT